MISSENKYQIINGDYIKMPSGIYIWIPAYFREHFSSIKKSSLDNNLSNIAFIILDRYQNYMSTPIRIRIYYYSFKEVIYNNIFYLLDPGDKYIIKEYVDWIQSNDFEIYKNKICKLKVFC